MLNTHTTEQLAEAVKAKFQDPKVRQAILNSVVYSKPSGWSSRSRATYYCEACAKQVLPYIDQMILDKKSLVWEYKMFPEMAPNTLYLRINHSIRYILDCLDPELKYRRWYEMTRRTNKHTVGVIISYKIQFRETAIDDFSPRSIVPEADKPKWRESIDKYMEDPNVTKPLIIENL